MQHQRLGVASMKNLRTTRADEHTRGRRQALHGDIAPAEAGQRADDLFQTVAAMDCEQSTCRF